jgi:hypothetical protein
LAGRAANSLETNPPFRNLDWHTRLRCHAINHMLEGTSIVDVGRVAIPINDEPQMVEKQTELPSDNLALIGNPLLVNLLLVSPFPSGVGQLNTISVNDSNR